ncbi:MAG: hypothetical protein KAT68_13205 [Bacteroidales bacterium]|nr:hypothetical protein [Bacteroidales bacterium]
MKKLTYLFLSCLLAISCQDIDKSSSVKTSKSGGTLKMNETEFLTSVNPHSIDDIVSAQILSQVFEGLVKYDSKNLEIVPSIAKKWKADESGLNYTFYLNNSVYFHEDKCFVKEGSEKTKDTRLITAEDFKYSFKLLCTQSLQNKNFNRTINMVVGAKKYFEESLGSKPDLDIEGIKIINDTTLQITIEKPNPLFIHFLANHSAVVIPKEAVEMYGDDNMIGTGPFVIKELPVRNKAFYLLKNKNYYKKDKDGILLPYLDSVKFSFIASTQKELRLFEEGKLDIVMNLTNEFVQEFLQKNINAFESNPPQFVLDQYDDVKTSNKFNLLRSNVNDFYSNRMNYIDISFVYLQEPKPEEKSITKE